MTIEIYNKLGQKVGSYIVTDAADPITVTVEDGVPFLDIDDTIAGLEDALAQAKAARGEDF